MKRERKWHIWDRSPRDWYVEPEWCSKRLFEVEKFVGQIHDPCAGMGRIVIQAELAGYEAFGFDIHPRRDEIYELDFLMTDYICENIVCNPPFGIARKFTELAIARSTKKCAMILPTVWLNGDKRSRWLESTPLSKVLLLTPRPSMPPGSVIEEGKAPGNGTQDFAWFIWSKGHTGPAQIGWLRRDEPAAMTRPGGRSPIVHSDTAAGSASSFFDRLDS